MFKRFFAWNDRRRARDYLAEVCEDLAKARIKVDELERKAKRASMDAQKLEEERFRAEFFGSRNLVRSAFMVEGGARHPSRFVRDKVGVRVVARETPAIVKHVHSYMELRGEAA